MISVYTNAPDALDVQLTEAMTARAFLSNSEMEDAQIIAFAPDPQTPSFDILSGPSSLIINTSNRKFSMNLTPDENLSIEDVVTAAIKHENKSSDLSFGNKPEHSKNPKK